MMKSLFIGNDRFEIGKDSPVYIIAEGGLTNWGDVNLAKQQVDMAMAAGVDAIKFQAQSTEDLVSRYESPYWYRRLKYKELTYEDLIELRNYCSIRNIDFFVTAHTQKDLDFIVDVLDVPFVKVGSGESVNAAFLEQVATKGKPVMISFGMHASMNEIERSIQVLEQGGCNEIIIMHCNTVYPTPLDIVDLGAIKKMQQRFTYPVGYSDHTIGWHVPTAAAALGAKVIEKHISFDKQDKRSLDCAVSCEPDDLKQMVSHIRDIEQALKCNKGKRKKLLSEARDWARQSIVAARDLGSGHQLTAGDLAFKRPGTGLSPDNMHDVIGKRLIADIVQDQFITHELLK